MRAAIRRYSKCVYYNSVSARLRPFTRGILHYIVYSIHTHVFISIVSLGIFGHLYIIYFSDTRRNNAGTAWTPKNVRAHVASRASFFSPSVRVLRFCFSFEFVCVCWYYYFHQNSETETTLLLCYKHKHTNIICFDHRTETILCMFTIHLYVYNSRRASCETYGHGRHKTDCVFTSGRRVHMR